MKQILFMLALVAGMSTGYAQYDKEKLVNLLTNEGTRTWMAQGVNTKHPEKSFTFNKDMSGEVVKSSGKGLEEPLKVTWTLETSDNIRWFITVASDKYELIVSYARDGHQYLKLIHQQGSDKKQGAYEMHLVPAK